MGYGPCDKNRLGYCWRNEHGSGTRLTPYFLTEKDCEDFHDFMTETWLKTNTIEVPRELQPMMSLFSFGGFGHPRPNPMGDLRCWKMKDAVRCARDFEASVQRQVIASCKGETMLEFFGCDLDESHDDKFGYEAEEDDAGNSENDCEEKVIIDSEKSLAENDILGVADVQPSKKVKVEIDATEKEEK
jgi:hypothetical protein